MFSILIKKEYRVKFKFTNFLYNDLWSLCESYFELIDESPSKLDDSTEMVNAMVASYNIVLYCGKTVINADDKEDIKGFVKHQMSSTNLQNPNVQQILSPAKHDSILSQLFNVTEQFVQEINATDLLDQLKVYRQRTEKELLEYQSVKA